MTRLAVNHLHRWSIPEAISLCIGGAADAFPFKNRSNQGQRTDAKSKHASSEKPSDLGNNRCSLLLMLGMCAAGELFQVRVALVVKLLFNTDLGGVVTIRRRVLDGSEEPLLNCLR